MTLALHIALRLALLLTCATSFRLSWTEQRARSTAVIDLSRNKHYYYNGRHSIPNEVLILHESVESSRFSFLLETVQRPFNGLKAKLSRQNDTVVDAVIAPPAPTPLVEIVLAEKALEVQPAKSPRRFWKRIKEVTFGVEIVSNMRRSLRRRLFNLWERQPKWAHGLGRESSDQSYVSTPEVRRLMAAESLSPRNPVLTEVPEKTGYFSGVSKALSSLFRRGEVATPLVMKVLPYNDTTYSSPPFSNKDEGVSNNTSGFSLFGALRAGGSWLATPFRAVVANVSVVSEPGAAAPPTSGEANSSLSLGGVTGLVTSFFSKSPIAETPETPLLDAPSVATAVPSPGAASAEDPLRGMLSKSGTFISDIFPVTGRLVKLFNIAKNSVSPRSADDQEEAPLEALQAVDPVSSPLVGPASILKYALDATVALSRRTASATLPLAKVLLDRDPNTDAPAANTSSSPGGSDPSLYFTINGDIAGKEDLSFMDRDAMLAGFSALPTYLPRFRIQLSDGLDGIKRDSISVISSAFNDSSSSAGQIMGYASAIPASIPAYAYDTISNNAKWLYNSMPSLQQMQQLTRAESMSGGAAQRSDSPGTNPPIGYANSGPQQSLPDIGYGKTAEFIAAPPAIDSRRMPLPAKADFAFIGSRRMAAAVSAALSITTAADSLDFLREVGLKPLLAALTSGASEELRTDAVKGLFRLLLQDNSVADALVGSPECMEIVMDMVEAPVKSFKSPFRSSLDRDKEAAVQYEAVRLMHRMVRCSERAADVLKDDARVRRVFGLLLQQADFTGSLLDSTSAQQQGGVRRAGEDGSLLESTFNRLPARLRSKAERQRFLSNSTIIMEYPGLSVPKMSRVIAAALGGVLPWRPKQPGQKGLRILSFDGGGTRGVLSIAIMKELMSRFGKKYPHEVFDVICGTSTGGIIACLAGAQRRSVDELEMLYDDLIEKVFGRKSNLKLVSEQALYDETELERVLYSISGDELFLDSNRADCARTFCVSTKVNTIPQTQIWRNYNYPPGQQSRYPGAFRVNTLTAIRATTAAPTFFTPVQWEGGLYCDGALVANNPTVLALQEAKVAYPGVPVELVVSIGTGAFSNAKDGSIQSMGWDMLVNQIIASSTDTEDVHSVLNDFLPPDKYFRFNPTLPTNLAIDETDKVKIAGLKELGKSTVRAMEAGRDAKRMEAMIKMLATKK